MQILFQPFQESVEPASKDPVPFVRSGAIGTAAALNRFKSHYPGIDDRCSRLFVHQDAVQARETVEEATPKCRAISAMRTVLNRLKDHLRL